MRTSLAPKPEAAIQPVLEPSGTAPSARRVALAAAAAVAALLAALVAAVGPARGESSEYSWPPAALPADAPERGWYAPLPLLNRVPASIVLRLPCELSPPLRRERQVRVLSTARRPQQTGALWVTQGSDSLRVGVGASEIATVRWPASCPLRLEVADGELRLPNRVVDLRTGALDDMPIVTGLFTNLDLRAGQPPRAIVRTRIYATSQTARQIVAAILAVVLAALVFVLLARSDGPHRSRLSVRHAVRAAWKAREPTDAVVVGTLLVWWIVAPVIFDDGWTWVMHRAFRESGAVSAYFSVWGVTSPLGLWLDWLRHWVVGSTEHLVLMRIPTLLAVLSAWFVSRWCLSRVVSGRPSAAARWTLAGAFVVAAVAWGMSLRPEPFVSLLMVTSLAAMVSFSQTRHFTPLTIAICAAVLGITAHPAGVVVIAPVLAALPETIGWLRRHDFRLLIPLGALLITGLTLALALFTLDADLATRFSDARLFREGNLQNEPWWREYVRYTRFDDGGGTPSRHLSVALLFLAVVAWLTRRRRQKDAVLALGARSVALALVLFAFLPSKWVWHFGVLAAVGAVAIAAEVEQLIRERGERRQRHIRSTVLLVLIGAIALWSWKAQRDWPSLEAPSLDLQRLSWGAAFGVRGYGWAVVALAVILVLVVRRRRPGPPSERRYGMPAMVGWATAILSFAVVGITIMVLVVDAAISPWSLTRQNVGALAGVRSCGLAHQIRDGPDLPALLENAARPTLLVPPIAVYFPCARTPSIKDGVVELPGLGVFWWGTWEVTERDAPFAAISDLYELRSIARGPRGVEVLSVGDRVPSYVRVDAVRRDSPR